MQFVFDAVKPDTLYVIGQDNGGGPPNLPLYFLKSYRRRQKLVPTGRFPFSSLGCWWRIRGRAGRLYLLSVASLFYRSTDGGVTWQSFPFPNPYVSALAVDPGNRTLFLAGSYRSNNGGETWSPTMHPATIQMTFAPTGKDLGLREWAPTSDAFLPNSNRTERHWSMPRTFGGMGNETAFERSTERVGKYLDRRNYQFLRSSGLSHGRCRN